MGITATQGAKHFSHSISFGVILAFLTNIAQYTYWKCLKRRGSHLERFGPLYLSVAAVPLVMADLTRHVLQDSGLWSGPSSSMYDESCCALHSCHGMHGLGCLSVTGVFFTIIFTYSGFLCLLIGVFWAADIPKKVKITWQRLRGQY
mmetsp:Transcript_11089/g.15100  ORF Transcript_11089/g.15100 Transcript_11089/m.15100 type:complete len:147 (+) Transcript_11089:341-781(+)